MIEGYCSYCFKKTLHKLKEKNYVRRNVYECSNCKNRTLLCTVPNCDNFAKGGDKWDDKFCAEHSGLISAFDVLDKKLNSIEEYKILLEKKSINYSKISSIAAFSLGGALILGPFAFAAAPAVGGAIGSAMGFSGAVATNAGLAALGLGAVSSGGLGVAGGVSVITALGTALGSTLSGVIANSYFNEVKGFKIEKIADGKGASIIVINGFLTQGKETDIKQWIPLLKKNYPSHPWYILHWESKRLENLGKFLANATAKETLHIMLKKVALKATKEATSKLNPIGHVYSILNISKNDWHVALVKATQTGIILADILARTDNRRKYILLGHSLGAKVIFHTLECLKHRKNNLIQSVHLMGGAVDRKAEWNEIANTTKILNNYYSQNDLVLKTLYKVGTFFQSEAIGVSPITESNDRIINYDVTSEVSGHSEYKKNAPLFFKK